MPVRTIYTAKMAAVFGRAGGVKHSSVREEHKVQQR